MIAAAAIAVALALYLSFSSTLPPPDLIDPARANEGPSALHWLGTDQLGRDVLSRTIAAAPLSLQLALMATALSVLCGTLVGIGILFVPRWLSTATLRFTEVFLAFPGILIALILAAIMGAGVVSAVLAIAIAGIPSVIRLTNSIAYSQLQRDHVRNARVIGVGDARIFRRYLLPPTSRSLGIAATYDVGLSLVAMASLSFLGLGVQLPTYDWGRLLGSGVTAINLNIWSAAAPAIAIAVAGAGFAALGEELSRRGSQTSSVTVRLPRDDGRSVRPKLVPADPEDAVVSVEDLRVSYPRRDGEADVAVDGVSMTIRPGEIVGVIGESGSGKSTLAMAVASLLPPSAVFDARALFVAGVELSTESQKSIDAVLSTQVSVVFQEPMSSLNPVHGVGRQITEKLRLRKLTDRSQTRRQAIDALEAVNISSPELRLKQKPFELSGGMRQRVMIAMGMLPQPRLLIADEPTTALDVTVQRQVLNILRGIRDQHGTSILFISHDLGVIATLCDRVNVMRSGQIVEHGEVSDVLSNPQHDYTKQLLAAAPTLDSGHRLNETRSVEQ